MRTLSFVIPSAPNRDHHEILNNLKKIHSKKFANKFKFEILIIKGTWPSAQRNIGISETTGEITFFFDDDVIIPAETIEHAVKQFDKKPKLGVLGGPNITPPQNTFLQKCFGQTLTTPFTMGNVACRYHPSKKTFPADENTLISCNLAMRSFIPKAHPYNEKMFHNEENEWMARIHADNHQFLYHPGFWVYHHRRPTLYKFLRQIYNWGRGRGEHIILAPKNFRPIFLVPSFFLLYLIALAILPTLRNNEITLIPLTTYFILDTITALQLAIRDKTPLSPFVTIWLMPLIHIIYGFSLISGLLRKIFAPRPIPHYDPATFQVIKEIL